MVCSQNAWKPSLLCFWKRSKCCIEWDVNFKGLYQKNTQSGWCGRTWGPENLRGSWRMLIWLARLMTSSQASANLGFYHFTWPVSDLYCQMLQYASRWMDGTFLWEKNWRISLLKQFNTEQRPMENGKDYNKVCVSRAQYCWCSPQILLSYQGDIRGCSSIT